MTQVIIILLPESCFFRDKERIGLRMGVGRVCKSQSGTGSFISKEGEDRYSSHRRESRFALP
jgi:hypothetical protein